ncbi:uncharacterized protein BXZ73DRAFT_105866 [Epithele typhae]|uniref:uncharacterized protein n=1 Tax=Epithele typhae TaxID=378194 RepID=UPI0020084371|nr:uncharacterized protein BXZ73DRAFT_105866 [Epithele typhae]KAH9916429.1 hypothetical protein BXZ73DRAFT_105866 [Epithele typhae]
MLARRLADTVNLHALGPITVAARMTAGGGKADARRTIAFALQKTAGSVHCGRSLHPHCALGGRCDGSALEPPSSDGVGTDTKIVPIAIFWHAWTASVH